VPPQSYTTLKEAMQRELREEIEREVPLRLWRVYERPHSDEITALQYVFIGTIDDPVAELALNEGQALGYFGQEAIETLPIGFGFETLLRDFYAEWEQTSEVV
jgi:ADP-ribose pyrophosphatase YjhB (NUDIX family)